ncbi:MAG: hypothetical protein ACR2H3_12925 [Acidimicrobiales bacterium]
MRATLKVGGRRVLRCSNCDLVREWVINGSGSLLDLGVTSEGISLELARLRDSRPLHVADLLAMRGT